MLALVAEVFALTRGFFNGSIAVSEEDLLRFDNLKKKNRYF